MSGQNENQLIARTLREYAKREIPDNPDPWPGLRSMTIPHIAKRAQHTPETSLPLPPRNTPYPVTKTRRPSFGIVVLALVIGAAALFAGFYSDAGQSTHPNIVAGRISTIGEPMTPGPGEYLPPVQPITAADSQQLIGLPAPDATLTDVSTGEVVRLSSFRGKAVMINIWQTRCTSCLDQMANMQQVYDKYKDSVQFVSISFGTRDTPTRMKAFLDQNKYPWTFLYASNLDELPYPVDAVPANYFINMDNTIDSVSIGAMNSASLESSLDSTLTTHFFLLLPFATRIPTPTAP